MTDREALQKIANKINLANRTLADAAALADKHQLSFYYETPFDNGGHYAAAGSDLDKEWNSSSLSCEDSPQFIGWVSSSDLCT